MNERDVPKKRTLRYNGKNIHMTWMYGQWKFNNKNNAEKYRLRNNRIVPYKSLTYGTKSYTIYWNGKRWSQPGIEPLRVTHVNKRYANHQIYNKTHGKVLKTKELNRVAVAWNGKKWFVMDPVLRNHYNVSENSIRLTPKGVFSSYTGSSKAYRRNDPEIQESKRTLRNYMLAHPIEVKERIYRGIPKGLFTKNHLNNTSFMSFSKSLHVARGHAGANGNILILQPGKYPAVENGRNGFKSWYRQSEREVLLAPGRLTRVNSSNKNGTLVKYNKA